MKRSLPPFPGEGVQASKKPRGKSREKKDADKLLDYSCVKMRLGSTLTDVDFIQPFIEVINHCVRNINQVALEAYMLLNYHVARCLQDKLPLPKLDQTFMLRCCTTVTDTTTESKCEDREFLRSIQAYKSLRPPPDEYVQASNAQMSLLMSNLAQHMVTVSRNHIVVNFPSRVLRYVKLRYHLKSNEAAKFVRGAFSPTQVKTDDQVAFKAWLEINPSYPDAIEKNLYTCLQKLADILTFLESLPAEIKGVRTFTLLPTKSSFIPSHIHIYRSTLRPILQLLDNEVRVQIMRALVEKLHAENADRILVENALVRRTACFSQEMFGDDVLTQELWYLFFDVKRLETRTRKFAFGLSTNGYEVSLRFQKPKGDQEEFDPMPLDLDAYDMFVGLDPGRTYLATTHCGDDHDPVQISTKEYRHMAKMNERTAWERGLREREPEYGSMIQEMPSLKTCSLPKLEQGIRKVLRLSTFLTPFCSRVAFRKWRFKGFIYSTKALVELSRRIVAGSQSRALVGFGDWSQQDGFLKGTPKGPVKRFRKELRNHATVVSVDEHRTSKVCSCCHGDEMVHPRLPKLKRCSRRHIGRFCPSENPMCRGCTFNAKNVEETQECHEVFYCKGCETWWQRDQNASRNIREVLMAQLRGEERPAPFRRQEEI